MSMSVKGAGEITAVVGAEAPVRHFVPPLFAQAGWKLIDAVLPNLPFLRPRLQGMLTSLDPT